MFCSADSLGTTEQDHKKKKEELINLGNPFRRDKACSFDNRQSSRNQSPNEFDLNRSGNNVFLVLKAIPWTNFYNLHKLGYFSKELVLLDVGKE